MVSGRRHRIDCYEGLLTEGEDSKVIHVLSMTMTCPKDLFPVYRLANQKVMELEAQIEDLQETAKSSVSSSELIELRKKIDEQVKVTQQKDKIIQKERDSVTELQGQITVKTEEIERLRNEIEKKEEEKKVMSEKYKKYFDKARAVSILFFAETWKESVLLFL